MKRYAIAAVLMALLLTNITHAADFGVGSYINSAGSDVNQQKAADLLGETNSEWTRMEVVYDPNYDFSSIQSAASRAKAKGSNVLLLFGHKSGLTAEQFESFVDTAANKMKDNVDAYEIFNEIDNTLSASDYKPFLEKAHGKIKAIDGSASVVTSGLTARKEAINYWNSLYDAGGGSFFDGLGIHPYRTSSPETKEFNIGTLVDSLNQAAGVISNHGGGKKIWITEFGWKSSEVGDTAQGNYLARSLILAASVPSVDKIIQYKLYDNDGGSYGIAKSDFSKKESFNTVATAISKLKGKGFSETVQVSSTKVIDNFDSVSGWKDDGSSNGSVALSGASGRSGGGMKYAWKFNGSDAYVVGRKQVALEGEPKGLSVWLNGASGSSVWKLRMVDKNNETFQFDLGQASSGWKQYTFDFAKDKAKTSWSGNGNVDYPVKFDSIVLDNQGGSSSGEMLIDDLETLHGETDFYALRFGSLLAYWKPSGGGTATVCGKSLNFEVYPQYTEVSSCEQVAASNQAAAPATTAKPKAAPKPPEQTPTPSASPTPTPEPEKPTAAPTETPTPVVTEQPIAAPPFWTTQKIGGAAAAAGLLAALIVWLWKRGLLPIKPKK